MHRLSSLENIQAARQVFKGAQCGVGKEDPCVLQYPRQKTSGCKESPPESGIRSRFPTCDAFKEVLPFLSFEYRRLFLVHLGYQLLSS